MLESLKYNIWYVLESHQTVLWIWFCVLFIFLCYTKQFKRSYSRSEYMLIKKGCKAKWVDMFEISILFWFFDFICQYGTIYVMILFSLKYNVWYVLESQQTVLWIFILCYFLFFCIILNGQNHISVAMRCNTYQKINGKWKKCLICGREGYLLLDIGWFILFLKIYNANCDWYMFSWHGDNMMVHRHLPLNKIRRQIIRLCATEKNN